MPQPRTLPAGAIARLGSDHFRSGAVIEALAFSSRGRIRIWDIAGGQIVRTQEGHRGGTAVLDFSPDGRRMLTAGGDCTALVWDAESLV